MWWTRRQRSAEDFRKEIEGHLALDTDRLISEGLQPAQAERTARVTFGNVTGARERFYESQRTVWLDRWRQDVRTAIRSLVRYPGAATIAILSLAGGIGAATTTLIARDTIFFRPPPLYAHPEELSMIELAQPQRPRGGIPSALYERWAQGTGSVIAGSTNGGSAEVDTSDRSRAVALRPVTRDLFGVLEVQPALGRTFSSMSEREGMTAVVLSHAAWRTLFDERLDAIGQPLRIGGQPYTVIGVMPERFWFDSMDSSVWTLLNLTALQADERLHVVVRRQTLTPTALEERLQQGTVTYAQTLPESQRQLRVRTRPVGGTPFGNNMPLVIPWVLGAAVVLTLLIACANVAVLVFAQWTARESELSVRASLGASRGRLIRLLITESLCLAVLGGALGVCMTLALRGVLIYYGGASLALLDFSIDPTVFVKALAITVGAGLVAGFGPALIETRRFSGHPLRTRTSEHVRQRWRQALVVTEITVTASLLVVTGTLLDGYRRSISTDLRFDTRSLLTAHVDNAAGVDGDRIVDRLLQVPGVSRAAAATVIPPSHGGPMRTLSAVAAMSNPVRVEQLQVGPTFFETLGLALRAGRRFSDEDRTPGSAVAMINEASARRLFPMASPVGAPLWIDGTSYQVVGVVADCLDAGFGGLQPAVYLPLPRVSTGLTRLQVVARTTRPPAEMVPIVRDAISRVSIGTVVTSASTLDALVAEGGRAILAATFPLVPLIGMGLLLTTAGIYGVLAFAITRRSKEFAIRLAIGARGADLVRLVTAQGLWLIGVGCGLGALATFALTRVVRAMGGGGSVFDTPAWPAFGVPVLVVMVVGALATLVPSYRALRTNPAALLRMQ